MSDYDNTNSGVVFQPHADQRFVLQGRLNIEGAESRCVIIKERLKKGGDPTLVLYQKVGVLFSNDSENEKAPSYSGPLDLHPDLRIAAWKSEKDGRPYMSLRVSPKEFDKTPTDTDDGPPPLDDFDDDIPF